MPDVQPPVDPDVFVPAAVREAAEAAAALHKAAYPQPEPPEQPDGQPEQPPAPDHPGEPDGEVPPAPAHVSQQQLPPSQPEVPKRPAPDAGETGSWEHRYLSMKGRFDQSQQTIGQMQETMSQLGDELQRTQHALQLARRGDRPQQRRPQPQQRAITPQDVEAYGPEFIDVVTRAARDAVAPDLNQVTQQVRQTSQQAAMVAQQRMEADLDSRVPDWRQINVSPRFKQWMSLRDVYSNEVRRDLIGVAAKAADAPRVAAFFEAFLAEERATGQMPDPQAQPPAPPAPREPAVPLSTLAAPGRAKPATGNGHAVAADKPIITRAQISHFYSNEGRQRYVGREADRQRDEQEIFAAQREGRVR